MNKKICSIFLGLAMFSSTLCFIPSQKVQALSNGVDVYEYSNITDYQALRNSGVSVVIQKATQGLYHNDSLLQYRARTLPLYGFKVGYYHFAQYNSTNPIGEAQHFLSQVQGLHSDTCLWLDIENYDGYPRQIWNNSLAVSYVNQFVSYIQSKGYKIGIYTGQSFYYEKLQGHIQNVPLWIASYGKQPEQFPNVVSWQFTGTGSNIGMSGYVDKDYFNDSVFTGQSSNISNAIQSNLANIQVIRDNQVSSLQSNLSHLLQWDLSIDGIKGSQTVMATKTFQHMCGLSQDGIAGRQTNNAINNVMGKPLLRNGSRGMIVKYLQYRLGCASDGIFGENTKQAVMNYQRSHGLRSDGIVGNATWSQLLK